MRGECWLLFQNHKEVEWKCLAQKDLLAVIRYVFLFLSKWNEYLKRRCTCAFWSLTSVTYSCLIFIHNRLLEEQVTTSVKSLEEQLSTERKVREKVMHNQNSLLAWLRMLFVSLMHLFFLAELSTWLEILIFFFIFYWQLQQQLSISHQQHIQEMNKVNPDNQ